MSDYLTRLVQRSLGLVPMVQPRVSPYLSQTNDLSGTVISNLDEPAGNAIENDAQHDSTETIKQHRNSQESPDTVGAYDGDDAASSSRSAESSRGVGRFFTRLFKPKMTDDVQLKQQLSADSSPILTTVASHSAVAMDTASSKPDRSATQSRVITSKPDRAKPAEHPRPGPRSSSPEAVTGSSRELALSEDAVSELPIIQTPSSEVTPQYLTARNRVPDSIDRIGRGTADAHNAQQHVSDPASEKNKQTSRSSVVDDSTKSASISSVHLAEVSREESSFQDETGRQDSPLSKTHADETDRQDSPLSETHAEVEPMGLQESGSRTISPRAMAAEISQPQFDYNNRPTANESSKIEIAIDRIEVRAETPTPPVRPRQANSRPTLSLDEYLNRSRRQRG